MTCSLPSYPPCNLSSPDPITTLCQTPVCNASIRAECAAARTFQQSDGSSYAVLNFVDPCDPKCQWESRCGISLSLSLSHTHTHTLSHSYSLSLLVTYLRPQISVEIEV